jgi:hypothetical protein
METVTIVVVVPSGWKLLLLLLVSWRIFQPLTYHTYVLLLLSFQEESSIPKGLNFPLRHSLFPFRLKGRFPFIFAPLEETYRMLLYASVSSVAIRGETTFFHSVESKLLWSVFYTSDQSETLLVLILGFPVDGILEVPKHVGKKSCVDCV